jgi:hypothetical protein
MQHQDEAGQTARRKNLACALPTSGRSWSRQGAPSKLQRWGCQTHCWRCYSCCRPRRRRPTRRGLETRRTTKVTHRYSTAAPADGRTRLFLNCFLDWTEGEAAEEEAARAWLWWLLSTAAAAVVEAVATTCALIERLGITVHIHRKKPTRDTLSFLSVPSHLSLFSFHRFARVVSWRRRPMWTKLRERASDHTGGGRMLAGVSIAAVAGAPGVLAATTPAAVAARRLGINAPAAAAESLLQQQRRTTPFFSYSGWVRRSSSSSTSTGLAKPPITAASSPSLALMPTSVLFSTSLSSMESSFWVSSASSGKKRRAAAAAAAV